MTEERVDVVLFNIDRHILKTVRHGVRTVFGRKPCEVLKPVGADAVLAVQKQKNNVTVILLDEDQKHVTSDKYACLAYLERFVSIKVPTSYLIVVLSKEAADKNRAGMHGMLRGRHITADAVNRPPMTQRGFPIPRDSLRQFSRDLARVWKLSVERRRNQPSGSIGRILSAFDRR